jgi:predicted MFS family arabinose efflux permease
MRDFRLLWTAHTVSALGTWLLIVAIPVHVYATTGSVLATTIVLVVESLPSVVIGPWAGVIADRWDRRYVLAAASLAATAGVALLLTGWIYVAMLVEGVVGVFITPAVRALVPVVASDLAKANTLMTASISVIRVGAPVLGTLIYVQGGFGLLVALDIASYLIAAAAALAIRATTVPGQTGGVRQELVNGLRYVWHTTSARGLLLSSCAFWTVNAGLTALLVPFLARCLGIDGSSVGYVITALGLGYVAGAGLCRWLLTFAPLPVLAACFATAGLSFVLMFTAVTLPVTIAGAFLAGLPGAVITTVIPHTIQVTTPNALLGRASAAFSASDALAALTGALLSAALSPLLGVRAAVIFFSLAVIATSPLTIWLLRDNGGHERRGDRERLSEAA